MFFFLFRKFLQQFDSQSDLHFILDISAFIEVLFTIYYNDYNDLKTSLIKSSLIIGGTSTLFLEALFEGVNYLVYEPLIGNVLIDGLDPVAPFDGSDKKVPVAKSEEDLERLITKKEIVDITILNEYYA